jgi:hypothetical protein
MNWDLGSILKLIEFILQAIVDGHAAGLFDQAHILADPRHPAVAQIAQTVKDKLDAGWTDATTPPA